MTRIVIDCILLYVSDAFAILLFLAGMAWAVEEVLARRFGRFLIEITKEQLVAAIFLQMGVILFALLGFKFVVLSGGPGVIVEDILSKGRFTQVFSGAATGLSVVLSVVGFGCWIRGARRWFSVRWYR